MKGLTQMLVASFYLYYSNRLFIFCGFPSKYLLSCFLPFLNIVLTPFYVHLSDAKKDDISVKLLLIQCNIGMKIIGNQTTE